MYRLTKTIPNDIALNLIPEISFNPSGTLFAVTHQQANEVVIFDSRTRVVSRVYQNPDARLDNPHGILLTDRHLIVSNTHGVMRPSSFAIYRLDDASNQPVSSYTTPYQHLREAHSLDLYNDILVASYCQNAHGPGAVVSYRFDDESGLIEGPICVRESCFARYSQPKGVAFIGDGSRIYFTYATQKRMTGLVNYARRLKAASIILQKRGVVEFFRYILARSAKRFNTMRAPEPQLKNGIAIFAVSGNGVLSEEPVQVLQRELFCRLENIDIVGDTIALADTINGRVYLHDLVKDPQLETPAHTITENVTLPHGVKLSPDQNTLIITDYGLKVSNQIIHWMTPAQDYKNSVLVYDRHPV